MHGQQVCGKMVGPQWFDVAGHSGEGRIPRGQEDPCLRQLSGEQLVSEPGFTRQTKFNVDVTKSKTALPCHGVNSHCAIRALSWRQGALVRLIQYNNVLFTDCSCS